MSNLALRVRLAASGDLEVETVDGRWLALRTVSHATWTCDPVTTLKYILREAADGQAQIGQRGNPTHAQLRHLERHGLRDWNNAAPVRYPNGRSGAQVRAASAKGQLRVSAVDLEDLL